MTRYQEIAQLLDANAITNVVDAYDKGRTDAIDEMIRILKDDWKYVNKDSVIATHLILEYERKLEQLKKQIE